LLAVAFYRGGFRLHRPGRPWIQSKGTPENADYCGGSSKREGYYNYIRIGRYTDTTKERQLKNTHAAM
jgi:hypothetical protein